MQTVSRSAVACSLVVMPLLVLSLCLGHAEGNGDCQLIPGRVNIVKEMTVPWNGRLVSASCTAEVTLSKCEGTCESSVSPSVRQHRGFRRDCQCCKEVELRQRTVSLNECYHDGQLMPNIQATTQMSITK
ncbi:hypothetical protein C0Q70_10270 [Pomacea canaliculata]|uniref:CTCK domain-containing protein n=1 Tax=Pomacea canaliculata TaxID=400727 RepID=A0A2T7PC47_POMCA|nr:hypothetical protein C0Q70_10270 [Pomacea canaliculata]